MRNGRALWAIVLAGLLGPAALRAQVPVLLKDVNTSVPASEPGYFITAGGITYFTALHGVGSSAAERLFRTDGTAAGTVLVKPDCIGGCDGLSIPLPTSGRIEFAGKLYFLSYRSPSLSPFVSLWVSDGTDAGTAPVQDLDGPSGTLVAGATRFYVVTGGSLWRSDGTTAGTVAIRSFGAAVEQFTTLGDRLVFAAQDDSGDVEPWVSDGTYAGTYRLGDLCAGPCSSGPYGMRTLGGRVYFKAEDGVHGRELWSTAGTIGSEVLVKDICPGACSSEATPLGTAGSRLVLSADDGATGSEPWATDGTAAGTFALGDLEPGSASSWPFRLGELGAKLVFYAGTSAVGVEPWVTDGTPGGTLLLRDVVPGPGNSNPDALAVVGADLYLRTLGAELWKTDGTPAGTSLAKLISPFTGADIAPGGAALGSRLVFAATDRDDVGLGTGGIEPWTSDGTAAGTRLIRVLNLGFTNSSNPVLFTSAGSRVFWFDLVHHLYVSDGTAGGTFQDASTFTSVDNPVALGAQMCFAGDDRSGYALWCSTGLPGGTRKVYDEPGGLDGPAELCPWGGTLYLRGTYGTTGAELYRSDGTSVALVADIRPGPTGSSPSGFAPFGGQLLFAANDGTTGSELWRSDGMAAGTLLLADIRPGSASSYPSLLTPAGSLVFFVANDGTHGVELWRTDGTTAGTSLVKDITPGTGGWAPEHLTAAGSQVFFLVNTALWRSDGTASGTVPLRTFAAVPAHLAAAGGTLFFQGADVAGNVEIWRSDGTSAGTRLVLDINPGPIGSWPDNLTGVGSTLYFTADSPGHGIELWRSDGTATGTGEVADLCPGTCSSSPYPGSVLGVLDPRLVFSADDGVHGREPWRLDLGSGVVRAPLGRGTPAGGGGLP